MNVGQLIEKLKNVDPNMKVIIPMGQEFDGRFYSPCNQDSGVGQMGTDPSLSVEDIKEMELLGKEIPEEDVFFLLPCGFRQEKDHSFELN